MLPNWQRKVVVGRKRDDAEKERKKKKRIYLCEKEKGKEEEKKTFIPLVLLFCNELARGRKTSIFYHTVAREEFANHYRKQNRG